MREVRRPAPTRLRAGWGAKELLIDCQDLDVEPQGLSGQRVIEVRNNALLTHLVHPDRLLPAIRVDRDQRGADCAQTLGQLVRRHLLVRRRVDRPVSLLGGQLDFLDVADLVSEEGLLERRQDLTVALV